MLLRRAGRLPGDTQSLLVVAAVTGPELQPELLGHVTGIDIEHVLLNLEPAIAAGLVTRPEGGWGLRFGHPLIHESLYASVCQVDRTRLHARVAAALEDISSAGTADVVVQLAYHYLSAGPFGDPAKAIKYAREAAARAVRQGAWQDAARHLEQALAAISPALPHAEAIRCDVLVELGQARQSGGLLREAHAAFDESISLADRIGDENRMLAAAVAFGAPQLWGPREWGGSTPASSRCSSGSWPGSAMVILPAGSASWPPSLSSCASTRRRCAAGAMRAKPSTPRGGSAGQASLASPLPRG